MASEYRLGQTQPNQFQNVSQTNYTWGSYYSDVDGVKTKGTTANNNAYSEMPRGYDRSNSIILGNFYNSYAATAETVEYELLDTDYADSVCPSGWMLPNNSGNLSFWRMLSRYGIGAGNGSADLQRAPLMFSVSMRYEWRGTGVGADLSTRRNGYYWNNDDHAANYTHSGNVVAGYDKVLFQDASHSVYGQSIRCVQRESE